MSVSSVDDDRGIGTGDDVHRRLAIVGGSATGHVAMGLAIAKAYQQAFENVSILFIGTRDGMETDLVPGHGFELTTVDAAPAVHRLGTHLAPILWHTGRGFLQARHRLRGAGVRLAFGVGGYVSFGSILAARSLGLRTAIHEANAAPGLANRCLRRVVDRVYVGWAEAAPALAPAPCTVTGNPVLDASPCADRDEPREAPATSPRRRHRILVTGGSCGSPFFNEHVPEMLARLAGRGVALEITHQTGPIDLDAVVQRYRTARLEAEVTPYIDDMARQYRSADFVITCAGAITLAELAGHRLPGLIVPLSSASEDHQAANAIAFTRDNSVPWVRERDWDAERLATQLAATLRDPHALATMRREIAAMARPNAAACLVEACEAMMQGHW